MVHLWKQINIGTTLLTKPQNLFGFHQSSHNVPFTVQDPNQGITLHLVVLSPLVCDSFCLCFSWPWHLWRAVCVFYRMSLNLGLPHVFSCLAYRYGFRDEYYKVPLSSHYYQGTWYHQNLLLVILILITWLRWCLPGFCNVKLLYFFPLFVLCEL